jgi:hypothetical protein
MELAAGHVGHIVAGIHLLTRQKVSIPSCPKCWALHRWGWAAGMALIAMAIALFVGTASIDHDTKLRMPDWVDLAVIVGSFTLIIIGGAVSALFTWNATSVLIYSAREHGLYYEFWSGHYHDFLKTETKNGKRELTGDS